MGLDVVALLLILCGAILRESVNRSRDLGFGAFNILSNVLDNIGSRERTHIATDN
jgi:hypothetical protein